MLLRISLQVSSMSLKQTSKQLLFHELVILNFQSFHFTIILSVTNWSKKLSFDILNLNLILGSQFEF